MAGVDVSGVRKNLLFLPRLQPRYLGLQVENKILQIFVSFLKSDISKTDSSVRIVKGCAGRQELDSWQAKGFFWPYRQSQPSEILPTFVARQ